MLTYIEKFAKKFVDEYSLELKENLYIEDEGDIADDYTTKDGIFDLKYYQSCRSAFGDHDTHYDVYEVSPKEEQFSFYVSLSSYYDSWNGPNYFEAEIALMYKKEVFAESGTLAVVMNRQDNIETENEDSSSWGEDYSWNEE